MNNTQLTGAALAEYLAVRFPAAVKQQKVLRVAGDAKTVKGAAYNVETAICYLAPAKVSGVMNVCTYSTPECEEACLYKAGRGGFNSTQKARIAKTIWLHTDRDGFMEQVRKDVKALIRRAKKNGTRPAVRFNGTSDLPGIAMQIARENPTLQCYDYTKLPRPQQRVMPNYHLTFSYSGRNMEACLDALAHNVNVSVVFRIKKGQPLPATWNGYKVIDGDLHDARFLDPVGCIVGLRAKGPAKKVSSPFVVLQ